MVFDKSLQIANIVNAVSRNIKFYLYSQSLIENHLKLHQLFNPLNISIVLVGVVVWNDGNKIELHHPSSVTLANFTQYRRDVLWKLIPNDNAHLLTTNQVEESVIGKALKGTMWFVKRIFTLKFFSNFRKFQKSLPSTMDYSAAVIYDPLNVCEIHLRTNRCFINIFFPLTTEYQRSCIYDRTRTRTLFWHGT